jgi:UDP-GlcNAc:undecaprenyl-phosphate GlcNAc-1-phosphate transferase
MLTAAVRCLLPALAAGGVPAVESAGRPDPAFSPAVAFGVAAGAAFLLTPLAALLARRLGVVDRPDGGAAGRKLHGKAVPLLGGAAVAAGVVAGLLACGAAREFAVVLAAAGVVLLVGLADDVRRAPVWLRLLVETAAAGAVVASGVRATFLVGQVWITAPMTVVWIVAMTNAFNFLDNMDGLSAGIAAVASGMFLLVCVQTGQLVPAAALAAVVGACLGFLPFNVKPARVFLGDAGSLLVGFLLGTLSVAMTFYEYTGTLLPLAAPLLVLAIPIFDAATVLWIRIREGRPLTRGDRSHFSHRLVALGMSERTAVLTIWLAAAAIGLGAVLLKDVAWQGGVVLLVQAAGIFAIVVLMERAGKRKGG